MAQPSYGALANSVSVIGPQYCVPYPIDIVVVRTGSFLSSGSLLITDVNHKMMFMVKTCETNIHEQRVLVDAANIENPIVTLRQKIMTGHERWQVFRGNSTANSDLIFSTKTPHMFQFKTKLNVYLAKNEKEDSCDFRLEGSWSDRSCKIFAGDSSTIIAQMHKKNPAGGKKLGNDKFMVTVNSNVDHAFIVSVFVILNAMKSPDIDAASVTLMVAQVAEGVAGAGSN